jgi:hypothetical protein
MIVNHQILIKSVIFYLILHSTLEYSWSPFAKEPSLLLGSIEEACTDPDVVTCYDRIERKVGAENCKTMAKSIPGMEGANPNMKYPPRARLSIEDMETFCRATTCLPGMTKPLLPPSVFEHIALLDETCLFTGRHIRGMKRNAEELRMMMKYIEDSTVNN